jgi:hypothetical protein
MTFLSKQQTTMWTNKKYDLVYGYGLHIGVLAVLVGAVAVVAVVVVAVVVVAVVVVAIHAGGSSGPDWLELSRLQRSILVWLMVL